MKKVFALIALVSLIAPGLPWNASTAHATGPNLIPNPSFEDGTATPTSWTKSTGSAKNKAVFTYPVAGYDGAKGAEVSMTTYKSGDVGWKSASFPVTAGTQYDVADFSKSNVASVILAIYTRATGKSTTSLLGTVGASATWSQFTKTITIPSGVTSMSLLHALRRNGTLDVDTMSVGIHDGVVPQPGTNLVFNGDLETPDSTNPAMPSGWSQGGWGTLTAAYTYPVAGNPGSAAKVDVSSYTNGDAKWVFTPIPTSAGKTYHVQFDYMSTVQTNISIEYHLTNGTYSYGWLGDPQPSAGWTTFSAQITIPSGADSFNFFDALVGVGSLTVDNFIVNDITSGSLTFPNGMVTLEFDDTWASQYTVALPMLQAAGIHATFAAVTDPNVGIGSQDYMTWTQVNALKSAGHEIAAHTRTHSDLTTLTTAQAWDEINGAKLDIMANVPGYTPTTFVYPFGQYNAAIKQQVHDAGFVGARTVGDGFNFPGTDKYGLLDKHVESTTTLADVQGWIANAVANHTWLVMELHEQTSTPGPDTGVYYNTPTMLQDIINAITSSGIQAVTIAQGISLMNP